MTESIIWQIDRFDNLSIYKLYNILMLRSEVFVVEQNCPYQDVDNKDRKALHLQGYFGDTLVAYCRLFKVGDYFELAAIGRVIVNPEYRKHGLGHILMDEAIKYQKTLLNESQIMISAQEHLKGFYAAHGFEQVSDTYLEDGIPHIRMQMN